MTKGIFVVLDGPDGSGKTMQMFKVNLRLKALGLKSTIISEPGAPRIGNAVLKLPRNKEERTSLEKEMCLLLADRVSYLQNFVYPKLQNNDVVICERYIPSTVVYQSLIGGFSYEDLIQLNKIMKIPEADLTFIFKIFPEDENKLFCKFPGDYNKPYRYHQTILDLFECDPSFRKHMISVFNELADKNKYDVVNIFSDESNITKQIVERILLERNK